MIRYIEGFSYFVTSITAPIASGWSEIAGWDSHPLRNAALSRRTPIPVSRAQEVNVCFVAFLLKSATYLRIETEPLLVSTKLLGVLCIKARNLLQAQDFLSRSGPARDIFAFSI